VNDLAAVNSVPQEVIERAPVERAAPEHPTGSQNTLFAPNSLLIEVGAQFRNAPEHQISGEDESDRLGLSLIYDQLSVMHVIAERNGAAYPQAFASRGRKLVPDALARDLPLKLSKREQNIEGQSPMDVVVLNC
jgi:hypothetical protein